MLDELLEDGHCLLVVALLLQTTDISVSEDELTNYQFLGEFGELGEDGVDLGLVAANVHHIGVLIRIGQGQGLQIVLSEIFTIYFISK